MSKPEIRIFDFVSSGPLRPAVRQVVKVERYPAHPRDSWDRYVVVSGKEQAVGEHVEIDIRCGKPPWSFGFSLWLSNRITGTESLTTADTEEEAIHIAASMIAGHYKGNPQCLS